MLVEEFFAYARERHSIYLKRRSGKPAPWTTDPILSRYRFTNVFRELDRTTIWFRTNIRNKLQNDPIVLPATVLFRWFNRIETGETLFLQPDLFDKATPFQQYMKTGKVSVIRDALRKQGPPWTTGAYIINSGGSLGTGKDKLDGILAQFEVFMKKPWEEYARTMRRSSSWKLKETHEWLMDDAPGMGPFMAYEVVSDLRWTALLRDAPDILTWANPGVGALRGASRVLERGERTTARGKVKPARVTPDEALELMFDLLVLSQKKKKLWPQRNGWPPWEMREVEHTLCEFDKYERARLGQGRPRGVFP